MTSSGKFPTRSPSGEFPWFCYKGDGAKKLAESDMPTQPGSVLVQQFCGYFYLAPSVQALCQQIVENNDKNLLRLCEAYDQDRPVKFCLDCDDDAVLEMLGAERMPP